MAVLHKAGWITAARHDTGSSSGAAGSSSRRHDLERNGVGRSSDVLAGRVAELALALPRLARRGG